MLLVLVFAVILLVAVLLSSLAQRTLLSTDVLVARWFRRARAGSQELEGSRA